MWSILRYFPGMWGYVLIKVKTKTVSHGLWSNCGTDICMYVQITFNYIR